MKLCCVNLETLISCHLSYLFIFVGKNVYRALFKNRHPDRNDLFLPKRMAYVVELEDDDTIETDVPTTLIRSKADCPSIEATTTLSTNDIVINKLTQILSYLRQGRRDRKRKMKEKRSYTNSYIEKYLRPLFTCCTLSFS